MKNLNRLIFIFSLFGLAVTTFLFYEYSLTGPVACPVGIGCDIVRASPYSHLLGISLPILGIVFYLFMAGVSLFRAQNLTDRRLTGLQLLAALAGFGFGVYLTALEAFVIKAYCFWCVLSFIISGVILFFVILSLRPKKNEHGN